MSKAPRNSSGTDRQQRHWLDHAAVWAAGAAALAAAAAAGVGAWQASIANEQLAIAKDAEIRQLRAYVGITIPQDGPALHPLLPPLIPAVHLSIKNYGQTPAYKVTHDSGLSIRAYPLPRDNKYTIDDIPLSTVPNPITVFPGAIDPIGISLLLMRALTDREIGLIQNGKSARLYAWGTVNYLDAFKNPRYTNFCFGFFNPTPKDVQYEPCNEHTDSD